MSATTGQDLTADPIVPAQPTGGRRKLPTPFETPSIAVGFHSAEPDDSAFEPPAAHPDLLEETDDPGTDGQLFEATTCEIALGVDDDAFSSTLLLVAGSASDEIGVWLRLTPTTITRLTSQLTEILHIQQEALGLIASAPQDDLDDEDDEPEQEKLLRRASDPAGVRFLRERPGALRWVTIGLGSLLIIAFLLQMTVYSR